MIFKFLSRITFQTSTIQISLVSRFNTCDINLPIDDPMLKTVLFSFINHFTDSLIIVFSTKYSPPFGTIFELFP